MRRASSLLLSALLLVLAVAGQGRAHAVVVRTSLDDTPVKAETESRVTIHFNGDIEESFTTMTLVDADGTEKSLELAPGKHEQGTVVVNIPPLAPGRYAIRYKILAVDGHVSESVVRFDVKP